MKLPIHNIKGKETSKSISLKKQIFGAQPNEHAMYLDVN